MEQSRFIYNLNINNYVFDDNEIIQSQETLNRLFFILHGTFINISSPTADPLFYSNSYYAIFYDGSFINISAEIVFYYDVKIFHINDSDFEI